MNLRYFYRRRGLYLRFVICWAIGLLALSSDEVNNYDQRISLRGDLSAAPEIVLITLQPGDFIRPPAVRTKNLHSGTELSDLTDGFFWEREVLVRLLEVLLSQNPRSIAIAISPPENLPAFDLTESQLRLMQDSRVFWSTTIRQIESLKLPFFAKADLSNLGSLEFPREEDGVIRKISPSATEVPQLVERMTGLQLPFKKNKSLFIQFRGGAQIFPHLSFSQLSSWDFPVRYFQNKIVIIGGDGGTSSRIQTPVGQLLKSEIVAQVTDNLLKDRFIHRPHFWIYAILYFFLTLIAVMVVTQYPHSLTLLTFITVSVCIAAFSIWCFDIEAFWFPAFSPLLLFFTVWGVFTGYQVTRIEKMNYRLQQEKTSLAELERLKNNFISLISHDLKTPIAKIQGVLARLRVEQHDTTLTPDINLLQESSDDLNRYIQSILKVLRVESREFKIQRDTGDINELIVKAIQRLKPLAAAKNIHIESELAPLFAFEFDQVLLEEVILNLIENAIKYSPAQTQITVFSEELDNQVLVKVKDQGPGIPIEEQQEIWQKFSRGSEQSLKTKGSGLGLYLVKYFIELHGGQVGLNSELEKGTEIFFTLPLPTT